MTRAASGTKVQVTGEDLTLDQLEQVAIDGATIDLSDEARQRIERSRDLVEATSASNMSTYGLNTGVGRFVDKKIPEGLTAELQKRVLRSHAAGVGAPYPEEIVRAAHLLRINTLARGYSGVRVALVEKFAELLNAGITPWVPARGSVGASGDLAPLAHLCLPVIGEGKVVGKDGKPVASEEVLILFGVEPIELASKEGLSLINGTQFMTAMGAIWGSRAMRLAMLADLACALTVEALRGSSDPFLPQIQELRPHAGQAKSAQNILNAMEGSTIHESHKYCDRVQDAYALRCAPQVHGASRDAINFALETVSCELNSVTDNPLVFTDEGVLRSNGNFHGQPIAMALDFAAIATAELANISERRIERLVNPALSGLPAFLTSDGGLNSGYMIAQYTAASLVSENKVFCHPACVDSIPTSAAQEDHVSMGNHAGLKFGQVLANAERVIAIELLCAAQAVDFLTPRKPGRGTGELHRLIREMVPHLDEDRILGDEIEAVAARIAERDFHEQIRDLLDWSWE